MFKAKTVKIDLLAQMFPERISEMDTLLSVSTKIYIDFANVRPWADKLGWHVEPFRVKQFFDSFGAVKEIKIYNGTLIGDKESEHENKDLTKAFGPGCITKPVKIMQKSIDVSSISPSSTDILKSFIRPSLLRRLKVEVVEYLNAQLGELNKLGTYFIEDRKCNFDVEIGRDMMLAFEKKEADCFVLWSGDSDFAGPIEQLLQNGKKVFIFSTPRRVASELASLTSQGLFIYDIQKIKNFICWNREMDGPKPAGS
ncbi:MAG: NYN domain-containing protein [Candidatus Doudnabacteria bacterium]|nr:NYN domain-containing protein [Candidatus Doudnabacteria bacterium]